MWVIISVDFGADEISDSYKIEEFSLKFEILTKIEDFSPNFEIFGFFKMFFKIQKKISRKHQKFSFVITSQTQKKKIS